MKIIRPKSKQPVPKNAKMVFSGKLFDIYQWEQKMFDGSFEIFEKTKRTDTVNIIAITPENKFIILNQEQQGEEKFISLAGGRMDEGEHPLAAAKRELLEETGYASNNWKLWDSVQPYSKSDWASYTFIAKDCHRITKIRADKGEKIFLRFVDLEKFIDTVYSEKFRDKEILHRFIKEKVRTENNNKNFQKIKKTFLT
jgi:8-oxo-dGTP pyrophosphatase MutT (NUDIX family)